MEEGGACARLASEFFYKLVRQTPRRFLVGLKPLSSCIIFSLVKIFEREEHADSFVAGNLRMNSLAYFQQFEETKPAIDETGARRDDREGVRALIQPEHIGQIRIGSVVIPSRELAGPVVFPNSHSWSVFCMSALTSQGFEGGIPASELTRFKEQLLISPRSQNLGSHVAVVLNVSEFQRRVLLAAQNQGLGGAMSLVTYVDDDAFREMVPDERAPFRKRRVYEHQREYRVALRGSSTLPSPFELAVGDLSDIVMRTSVDTFNSTLQVRFPDGTVV